MVQVLKRGMSEADAISAAKQIYVTIQKADRDQQDLPLEKVELTPSWLLTITTPGYGAHAAPAKHALHFLQESTMQPTPMWSPSENFVTALPTAITTPASSWPGTHGYLVPITAFMWLAEMCRSPT